MGRPDLFAPNSPRVKILVELRPALEGYAGIPQETRLLFCGLGQIEGIEVQGLIQSSNRFLTPGLPHAPGGQEGMLRANEQIQRLSSVVVSIQAPGKRSLAVKVKGRLKLAVAPAGLLLRSLLRRRQRLTHFDPTHFRDFIWRALFAKTLPVSDFVQVTRARFRVARAPYAYMHACGLFTRSFGHAIYPILDTRGIDVLLSQTPYPASVGKHTRVVVRYFDAVPLLMPHTIVNRAHHQALHYQSLRHNVKTGAHFVCCSEATRRDLIAVFPEVEPRTVTIPCMLSHHYFSEDSSPQRVGEILLKRLNHAAIGRPDAKHSRLGADRGASGMVDYLLMVSTLEPRKNHLTMLEAWEMLNREANSRFKLVLVGALGWDHESLLERLQPWLQTGDVLLLEGVPAEELRLLYRHARVTVCPSYSEGFGYSGVEAMRCGGVVAASDIPVHREIYADAADYFNPYSAADIVRSMALLADRSNRQRRESLIAAGSKVSARYLPDQILPRWSAYFSGLR